MVPVCWYVVLCCASDHFPPSDHGNTRAGVVMVGCDFSFLTTAAGAHESGNFWWPWNLGSRAAKPRENVNFRRLAIRRTWYKTKSKFSPRLVFDADKNNSHFTIEKNHRTSLASRLLATHLVCGMIDLNVFSSGHTRM